MKEEEIYKKVGNYNTNEEIIENHLTWRDYWVKLRPLFWITYLLLISAIIFIREC